MVHLQVNSNILIYFLLIIMLLQSVQRNEPHPHPSPLLRPEQVTPSERYHVKLWQLLVNVGSSLSTEESTNSNYEEK